MFRALVVEKDEGGATRATVQRLQEARLPEGNVTVDVEYSTLNYKDALCMGSGGGMVRSWPHVPGIDFAGVVEASDDARFRPGDYVVLTGWRVGENRWGGYAEKARVMGDWLVPLPKGMTTRQAMALGTAGFTAMLAMIALEAHGLEPDQGEVLVTGAAGGVGSVAVALLAARGYRVAAVTGRPDTADYLRDLGASRIVPRGDLAEVVAKPLESETWAGCIDNVGGAMLARVLGQMKANSSVAAVGLAGGAEVPMKVTPFILRGVNLLGIHSVTVPYVRRLMAWERLASDLPMDQLDAMVQECGLGDLPDLGQAILAGDVKGRVVVDVRR